MSQRKIPIISVTGTKGKTTFVNVMADVLHKLDRNVLKVDTTGHYVNGVQKSTLQDSKEYWGCVPSLAPGRYLWEFYANPELRKNAVAVLECSLGCDNYTGLGYRYHDVGVFLNVFEDHTGAVMRGGKVIQTPEDIAQIKEFIFRRIGTAGYAVFNADDALVCDRLSVFPEQSRVNLIPCGLKFEHFDLDKHLAEGGVAVTVDSSNVVIRSAEGDTVVCDLKAVPWTFDGQFTPSVWNMLHVVGALYGYYHGELPDGARAALESTRLVPEGGRLVPLVAENGVRIIADYAHEKVSLKAIADLAHKLTRQDGKVIGVVRLAYDRTDEQVRETGHIIADSYDALVVYDKIDGYWRQPESSDGWKFPQVTGRTSQILADAIKERNANTDRIVREDEAIARAAELAKPGDVVIVIVNEDISRSLDFIKEKFNARIA